ncbi:Germinal-center associated nuclear protein [Stylophora pistillata]|uniref:Germinal-center associated nuclear protein n=1 Tax=Stylophora pistillata TaxID=50429 RepID=A0A2B4RFK8_STYPI|nr:Germinal-center associated nuclear protein [Stylophora pistillata]
MLSQIREMKKKEAVRRLSQGSGAAGYPHDHGSALSSQAPRQPPQWRKRPEQQKTKKQHPGAAGQRPARRSYVSPLDRNPVTKSDSEAKQIKHTETVKFGFGATPGSFATTASQSTIDKPEISAASSAKPFFSAGFPTSASCFQQNAAEAITSITSTTGSGLATGFGISQTNANAFAASPSSSGDVCAVGTLPAPSFFAQSQTSNPFFSSGFQMNSSLTLDSSTSNASLGVLSNPVSAVKGQSSGNLSFCGFRNVVPSPFTKVSSSNVFGAKTESETVKSSVSTSLTFGKSATPSLQVKSTADSKPLFAGTSQSTSNTFGVAKTVKPQTRIFGHSLTAVKGQQLAKENKEQVAEDKLQNVDISNLTTLVIKGIPESYNKNAVLKRFYSPFGEVSKVRCNIVKRSATVTFKTHEWNHDKLLNVEESAELAKKRGRILRSGLLPVIIFWKLQRSRRRTTSESEQQTPQSPDVYMSPDKRYSSSEKIKKILTQTAPSEKQTQQRIKTLEVLRDIEEYLKSIPESESAGEKLQVLEEIDRKLRVVFKRSSDISSAKAVVGTCKDMCPEKERYMREHQRRLRVFEAVSGTGSFDENPQVDHTCAVKEYDRSAADKEEPLPHELRPVPVLRMTMDYLATNIMNLCEGREGEWFDFLWNRTRGIRKDITQQHLCDPDCVDLVEKTARFHIFCAHFLCEADMNSFDAKINTENLTKCLQTLKQFYGDLLIDKGVTCPQEAEFRAYDILLNLNEGDILGKVMTFRSEVQQSPEVRFAMAVYHALNNNNFVRFFRLLRFISECLLRVFSMAI